MKSIAAVSGSIFAFLSVALGAFGAHFLKTKISEESLKVFQTGVQYQIFHALALLLVSLMFERDPATFRTTSWLFIAGIIIFSGSLYTLAVTGVRSFGAITPIGGVCFLVGWLFWIKAALRS